MSEEDTGSSDPETSEEPEPEPTEADSKVQAKIKKSKPAKDNDEILKCSNGCGFMTRWPKAQALKVGKDKQAKEPYLCPNCDTNGMSGKLVPYP